MAEKRNNKKEIEKLSFEQTIESLTQIVDRIETGQVSLAESLEQYEKGMAMIKHCRGILLDAEKRIEQVAENKEEDTDENEQGAGEADDSKDDVLF
ncbi:MAG: exodeoxyribonuclease VII small subunit [Planctomycetes bacterium]|nr:exodeoxyribonuclease VII small subunit [Planctomycetota bacterium]